MAVQGRTRTPAANGDRPWTVWRNWTKKKMAPNIPKLNSMAVTLTEVNPRSRNSRMSNMGWSDRSSQATNPTRASTPTTNEVNTRVLVQPWLLPSTRPRTTPSKPVLTTATPTRSRRAGRRETRTTSTRPAGPTPGR